MHGLLLEATDGNFHLLSRPQSLAARPTNRHVGTMRRITAAPTYRWSVEEYQKLGEVGIFHEDDRVELLDGEIVDLGPIGLRHMNAVRRLNNVMFHKYGNHCLIDVQNPLMIDGWSVPQPDFMLLRHTADARDSAPLPEDVLLLVEVAETSLLYDLSDKRNAYARTGIAEYWLLNLTRNQLHVFRDPEVQGYRSEQIIPADGSIAPLAFPDEAVALTEILPP
jgi:Uma2 family endonuclease